MTVTATRPQGSSSTSTMISSAPEVSFSSDLKADDLKAQVETMDPVPTANRSSSMPSLSAAGAHSDNNTPPPYEEPSRNDNANDSHPGSGDITSSYFMNDRWPLIFRSNPANNSSSGRNMGRKCKFSPLHLAILVLGIISAVLAVLRLPNVAPQPAAQARIRDEWDNEVHAHEALRADWAREREEILSLRAELERDRENWKREHVAQAQRHQEEEVEWEREIQAHADLRADWVRAGSDITSLRAELQHQKAEWERERLAQVERRQKEEVEWDKEIQAHEALRADWARKRDDVEALRADLQHEKAEWERERLAQMECRQKEGVEWDKEIQAHEALRADWARERVEWDKEIQAHEALRADWAREEVEWEKEIQAHEALRADWARERDDVEALRADLQCEKAEWKRQRAAEKRRKEDEDARVRAKFRWEDLTPAQRCLRHNARGYTARLANVPRSYDPVQACNETAIEIPGVKIKGRPLKCEDRGCSGVFGHWIAESGESICATYFKNFDDKGCTSPGSRRRRIQSRLENLQSGDDGRKMCFTTPATFRHQHFPKPDTCDIGVFGVWGVWEIKDKKC
ncbi:hypothetical protein B0H13DRAFT_493931 [Mycena leptocephala]|nr:hypothetical protein B0H13DRAFT_493931 [Mycena leptocephala]